jgi:hypothetical protein
MKNKFLIVWIVILVIFWVILLKNTWQNNNITNNKQEISDKPIEIPQTTSGTNWENIWTVETNTDQIQSENKLWL